MDWYERFPGGKFSNSFTISYDSKIDKQISKTKYTQIWKKNTAFKYLSMFSGYPTILWDKGVLIEIHASTYMLKLFDCKEGKQVRHADGFQWMFASIYPEQKVIGRCIKRNMSAIVLQGFS